MTYFGTDGVRGLANTPPMDPETILALALAAGKIFASTDMPKGHKKRVVIGKDTRISGYMIEPALTAGFIAQGFDVTLVGPLPTPAVSLLTRSLRADVGVMITASHNPYYDNGLKFFNDMGEKISAAQEAAITALVSGESLDLSPPSHMGKAVRLEDARGRYVEFVKSTLAKGLRLEGLRIVVDTANGACYKVAPDILWELGAEVFPIFNQPNGRNINDTCGALYPTAMIQTILETKAHIGIAFDGDGDRVIVADETGQIIDGDCILAMLATALKEKNALPGNQVVSTVMSNMGFERYLNQQGITLHRSGVGDKHVAALMQETGAVIGGEQSGHIILSDYTPTGDGVIAALQILEILVKKQTSLSVIAHPFIPYPQILKSYSFAIDPMIDKAAQTFFADRHAALGETGRVFIRKSGTEPLIRVMVEGENAADVARISQEIEQFLFDHGYCTTAS